MSETLQDQAVQPARGRTCPECGTEAAAERGRFCAECGAQLQQEPPTVRHFVGEALHELSDLDSVLLRSLRALLARPGELTRAFMDGPRGRYLRPLRIFFMANVLYFFVAGSTGMQTFSTPLHYQIQSFPAGLKRGLVPRKLAERKQDLAAFTPTFDATTDAHARTLLILMVPIYAGIFALLLAWRRRPAVQHLAFATHFMAFYLVLLCATVVLLLPPVRWAMHHHLLRTFTENHFAAVVLSLLSVYTYLAVRRAYATGRLAALAVTAAAGLLALPAILLYRFFLFFSVLLTV